MIDPIETGLHVKPEKGDEYVPPKRTPRQETMQRVKPVPFRCTVKSLPQYSEAEAERRQRQYRMAHHPFKHGGTPA